MAPVSMSRAVVFEQIMKRQNLIAMSIASMNMFILSTVRHVVPIFTSNPFKIWIMEI